jgi:BirA family transcriptional regulator, biotin operon repressor / biotin---[acetyl-CoA-carboxylase] ligase
LLAGWTPRRVGRRIVLLAEAESTNTLALAAAGEPESDGLVVLADAQTAGRGRLGATWLSPRGASVLASVVLLEGKDAATYSGKKGSEAFCAEHPTGRSARLSSPKSGKRLLTPFSISAWLTQAAAVAACDAIRQATDVTPAIKWPNDLRIGGRKVGGILIETRTIDDRARAWVVGIGINCLQQGGHFSAELRESATSLELATDHPVDRAAVARELLKALDGRLEPEVWGQTEQVHRDWLTYAEPLGQKVRLRREGKDYAGWTVEVDPVGGLIVKLQTGQQEWFDPMRTKLL